MIKFIIQRDFTFADIFPGSLYDWKITPSKLNCNVKVVIHCRHFVEFLPWVATPVTVVWLPRSTWSHWLWSFLRDDHPPFLIPCSMEFSLACLGALLLFICEDALIWAPEIAPLAIPRAPANLSDTRGQTAGMYTWFERQILINNSWISFLLKFSCLANEIEYTIFFMVQSLSPGATSIFRNSTQLWIALHA